MEAYFRWIYLERERTEEPFRLFSDYQSLRKHLNLIKCITLPLGLSNLAIGFANLRVNSELFPIPLINLMLGAWLIWGTYKIERKRAELADKE